MNRTQIYLPNSQQAALKQEARKPGTAVSEVIRGFIYTELFRNKGGVKPAQPDYPTLLEVAKGIKKLGKKLGVKGPKDLSKNLDGYLYGGK